MGIMLVESTLKDTKAMLAALGNKAAEIDTASSAG